MTKTSQSLHHEQHRWHQEHLPTTFMPSTLLTEGNIMSLVKDKEKSSVQTSHHYTFVLVIQFALQCWEVLVRLKVRQNFANVLVNLPICPLMDECC